MNRVTVQITDQRGDAGGVVIFINNEDGTRTRTEISPDTLGFYMESLAENDIKVV